MWRRIAVGVGLTLPWIQPFAPGPSPNVGPWLASAACALAVFLLVPGATLSRKLLWGTVAAVLFVLARPATGALDRAAFGGACALMLLACSTGRAAARDEAMVRWIALAWFAAALVSSLIALLQYFGLSGDFHPWIAAAKAAEAVGNLRQRNQLASLTTIGLAATLWLLATGRLRLPLALAAAVLLAFANAATTSRTGLVEWVFVFALSLLWRGPQRRLAVTVAGGGLATYAVATWVLPLLLEHVAGVAADTMLGRLEANLGCSSRRVLWANVLQLVGQHPWLGWGWGELDYAHYMHLYGAAPRFCDILDNAHNLPLHVAAELGVPAALLLCALVLVPVLRARPWAETEPTRQLGWLVLGVVALHSMVEYPLWYGPFQLATGLAAGLLMARGASPIAAIGREVRIGVATAGIALLAYASWDYERVSQIYLEPEARRAIWRDDTLAAIRRSWLFAGQARFADLTLAQVTAANAAWAERTGLAVLHYSPEPRVIERVIEAATLQGHLEEAVLHLARYRAAFPADYEKWRREQALPLPPGKH